MDSGNVYRMVTENTIATLYHILTDVYFKILKAKFHS